MINRSSFRRCVLFLITLGFCVYIYELSNTIPPEVILHVVNSFGMWGPVLFILLNVITYIILPLSNAPLSLAGFIIFGPNTVLLLWVGMVISVVINYWIGRIWGKKFVSLLAGDHIMLRINDFANNYQTRSLLFYLRLLQGGLHKYVSYAIGLTDFPFWPYLIISLIGMTPVVLMWYVGTLYIENPITFLIWTQIMGSVPVGIFLIIAFFKKRRVQ